MPHVVIENPILNSPFREPNKHFRFADEGHGRGFAGYSENNLEHFRNFYATYPGLLENAGMPPVISEALPWKSWKPGLLHPDLSWAHYRMLLKSAVPAVPINIQEKIYPQVVIENIRAQAKKDSLLADSQEGQKKA